MNHLRRMTDERSTEVHFENINWKRWKGMWGGGVQA